MDIKSLAQAEKDRREKAAAYKKQCTEIAVSALENLNRIITENLPDPYYMKRPYYTKAYLGVHEKRLHSWGIFFEESHIEYGAYFSTQKDKLICYYRWGENRYEFDTSEECAHTLLSELIACAHEKTLNAILGARDEKD